MLFTIVLHLLGAGPYRTLHVRTPSVGFMFIVYLDLISTACCSRRSRRVGARRGAERRGAMRSALLCPSLWHVSGC